MKYQSLVNAIVQAGYMLNAYIKGIVNNSGITTDVTIVKDWN